MQQIIVPRVGATPRECANALTACTFARLFCLFRQAHGAHLPVPLVAPVLPFLCQLVCLSPCSPVLPVPSVYFVTQISFPCYENAIFVPHFPRIINTKVTFLNILTKFYPPVWNIHFTSVYLPREREMYLSFAT